MPKPNLSLKGKFLTISLTIITLCLILVIVTTVSLSTADAQANYLETAKQQIELVEYTISTFYSQVDQDLEMLATHPLIQKADNSIVNYKQTTTENQIYHRDAGGIEELIFRFFEHYATTHQEVRYLYLATPDGGYINWPEETLPAGYDPTASSWYQTAIAGGGKITRTTPYQATSGEMVISNLKSIYKPNGELLGVMGMDIDSDAITQLLASLHLGETGFFVLSHKNGTILADVHHKANNFQPISSLCMENPNLMLTLNNEPFKTKMNGISYSAFTKHLTDEPWVVTSFIAHDEIFGSVYRFAMLFVLLGISSLIVMTITLLFCIKYITKSMS